jgi:hypothetical protein
MITLATTLDRPATTTCTHTKDRRRHVASSPLCKMKPRGKGTGDETRKESSDHWLDGRGSNVNRVPKPRCSALPLPQEPSFPYSAPRVLNVIVQLERVRGGSFDIWFSIDVEIGGAAADAEKSKPPAFSLTPLKLHVLEEPGLNS